MRPSVISMTRRVPWPDSLSFPWSFAKLSLSSSKSPASPRRFSSLTSYRPRPHLCKSQHTIIRSLGLFSYFSCFPPFFSCVAHPRTLFVHKDTRARLPTAEVVCASCKEKVLFLESRNYLPHTVNILLHGFILTNANTQFIFVCIHTHTVCMHTFSYLSLAKRAK
jgi:hypothetical protein